MQIRGAEVRSETIAKFEINVLDSVANVEDSDC